MAGQVIVDRERCKGCSLCISVCPREVLIISKEANTKGYYPVEIVQGKECSACSFCALMCPDLALEVLKD